jgi:hypothetical protein
MFDAAHLEAAFLRERPWQVKSRGGVPPRRIFFLDTLAAFDY